jgi:hypothetical protein
MPGKSRQPRSQAEATMRVTLKEYLARLESIESVKPEGQRREVPTLSDLAAAAGIHPMTMSKWISGRIGATNHRTSGAIIMELRQRGFPAEVADILAYVPPPAPQQMS